MKFQQRVAIGKKIKEIIKTNRQDFSSIKTTQVEIFIMDPISGRRTRPI